MPKKEAKSWPSEDPKKIAANAAKLLLITLAAYGTKQGLNNLSGYEEPIKQADAAVTQKVALNQKNAILTDGKAVVSFGKGKRATITSPILATHNVVLERTPGTAGENDLVTAYQPGSSDGANAESVTYIGADGEVLTPGEAMAQADHKRLNVSLETGQLVVSAGQVGAGEPVAFAAPQSAGEQHNTTLIADTHK